MVIVERISGHYEVEEVTDFGRSYKWCPAQVVARCRGCGKGTTFKESLLVTSIVTCECGERSSAGVREALIAERMADEQARPWRYWRPKEGAGIPF